MNGSWLNRARITIAGAIGVTMLMGAPLLAQADQGKWWKPKEGDRKSEGSDRGWRENRGNQGGQNRDNRGDRGDQGTRARGNRDNGGQGSWQGRGNRDSRGDQGAWRGGQNGGERQRTWSGRGDRSNGGGGTTWRDRGATNRVQVRERTQVGDRWRSGSSGDIRIRDRRYSARGSWGGTSVWRGYPVRRDVLTIRDNRYGGYFRARRIYCAPRYYGRFVYVRPVRFFVAANFRIGGVHIGARIVRPHYLYGCNFCDERFDSYDAYAYHVHHCPYAPNGLSISVSNWDNDFDSYWDGPYRADDSYQYDDGYNNDDYNNDSNSDYNNDDSYYDDSYDGN
jgi:hypothetical protein